MKRTKPAHLIAVAAACAALWPAAVVFSTPTMTQKQAKLMGVTVTRKVHEQTVDKLIVRMRTEKSQTLAQPMSAGRVQTLSKTAGVSMKSLRTLAGGSQLMQLERPMTVAEARAVAARLSQEADVQYAEPNIRFKKLATPNEPRYTQWQWNLFAPASTYTGQGGPAGGTPAVGGANLPTAWDLTKGTDAVTIAIIDTGMTNHTDLNGVAPAATYVPSGRFLPGYDFISLNQITGAPADFVSNDGNGRDADPSDPGDWVTVADQTAYPDCRTDPADPGPYEVIDSSWHGTHMAGIAAATANNSVGIAGIGWNVKIVPVRALGKCGGDLADIADAIRWSAGLAVANVPANTNPAQVISLSLGGVDACSTEMQDAVNAARAEGAVVIAATGNAGDDTLFSPASCANVVAVTAHTINGENADYANVGTGTTLSAPGGGSPYVLGKNGDTDKTNFDGYYIHSTVLFGPTGPTSATAAGSTGPAYAGFTGTSAATPHVAGVAALIKSAYPGADPAQIASYLTTSATMRTFPMGSACLDPALIQGLCGAGMLDARLAVELVGAEGIPSANAGPDLIVAPNSTVSLNGSGTAFPNKTITGYAWTQTSGSTVTLANANTATATFAAPATGSRQFRLRVTDDNMKTGDDLVVVRVNNAPVLAAAPAAQSAVVGATVTFTVTASDADGDPLTFTAAAQSTVPVTALSPTGQFSWNTTGLTAGTFQLAYFATDGSNATNAQSATQTVTITLTAPPTAANPPTGGGGGGGGALPALQLLLLAALLTAPAIRQRKY